MVSYNSNGIKHINGAVPKMYCVSSNFVLITFQKGFVVGALKGFSGTLNLSVVNNEMQL